MIEYILPFGSNLKPLLLASNISDSDLRKFLNGKGIFLSNYTRESIIPLLVSSLISPSEFELLETLHKSKEEKEKTFTTRLKTKGKIDIIDALSDFSFDAEGDSCFENYNYNISPAFTVKDDEYSIPYEITRIDRVQDWNLQETTHHGALTIRNYNNNIEIELVSNYTAAETKEINQKLVKAVTKQLKEKDLVAPSDKPIHIKFEDFDNQSRFEFLLDFKSLDSKIRFSSIIDIEFGPDDAKSRPPQDIQWIKDHVRKLILKGKQLEEIPLLNDKSNYEYLIIERVIYSYSFAIDVFTGECTISFGFPSILKKLDPMNPFTYSINSLKVNWEENKPEKLKEKTIRKYIESKISETRESNFITYKL